jgi:hypothetical protein
MIEFEEVTMYTEGGGAHFPGHDEQPDRHAMPPRTRRERPAASVQPPARGGLGAE